VGIELKVKFYWFTLLFLIVSAIPALAQFEVSPDHFDDNPSSSPRSARSNPVTSLKLQIAKQKKLLASYQDQLLQKSALVARARQAQGNSSSAAARTELLRQKRELGELRQSLSGPIRNAQLALARLERQQQALRPSARARHAEGSSAAALSAAN
jgi:hypothetical protein